MSKDDDSFEGNDVPDFFEIAGEATSRAASRVFEERKHILNTTAIAPGSVIKPGELAPIIFEKLLARKSFYPIAANDNAWLISVSDLLPELHGVKPETIEMALDIISAAFTKRIGTKNELYNEMPLFMSQDNSAFGIVFHPELEHKDILAVIDKEQVELTSLVTLLGTAKSRGMSCGADGIGSA